MHNQSRSEPGERVLHMTVRNKALARGNTIKASPTASRGQRLIESQFGSNDRLSTDRATGTIM